MSPKIGGSNTNFQPPFIHEPDGSESEHVPAEGERARNAPKSLDDAQPHNVQSDSDPSEASGSSLLEQVVKRHGLTPVKPRYIQACQSKAWTVRTWRKDDPTQEQNFCYACKSWRCAGDCARANAAQLFARLKTSIERVPDLWSFFTLTLNPNAFKSRAEMYKAASRSWNLFRHALKYKYGYDHFFIAFEISVRGKALHIHGIVRSKKLAAALALAPGESQGFYTDERGRQKRLPTNGERAVWKEWLKPTAIACGFGFKCEVSAVNDHAAMSGYLVKSSNISGELSQAGGKDQLPIDAPKGFRRIRASKGFLVKKIKNEEVSGRLIQRPREFCEDNKGPRLVHLAKLERTTPRTFLSYLDRLEKVKPAGVEERISALERHRKFYPEFYGEGGTVGAVGKEARGYFLPEPTVDRSALAPRINNPEAFAPA